MDCAWCCYHVINRLFVCIDVTSDKLALIISIHSSMGSMLIGTLGSAVLLGVTYIQTFYYFLGKLRPNMSSEK